jgi:molybdopterin molybdotransferase
MRGFQDRVDVEVARQRVLERLRPLQDEAVLLPQAAGRVLAADVVAEVAVPPFDRAAMDGYALRGEDTFGASAYNPLELAVIGVVLPGKPFAGALAPGQAVRIMTGAPVPAGADAVLQAEAAEESASARPGGPPGVRIAEPVPPGRNVGRCGEDIQPGSVVLAAGRRLRPQDLGLLASLGVSPVRVVRSPKVAILVTGDELLPCGSRPEGHRIVDSNSVMLAALLRRDGAEVERIALLADRPDTIREALEQASADVILISGGSSVGQEDHAPQLLGELGEIVFHGVALRPASPAGAGFLPGGRTVFLLPGNPVSCLCAYDLFAGPAVRRLAGRSTELPYRTVQMPLARKIASVAGRVDYTRVQLHAGQVEPLATSGASILSSTTRADGFVLVPRDSEGYPPGTVVTVHRYDE